MPLKAMAQSLSKTMGKGVQMMARGWHLFSLCPLIWEGFLAGAEVQGQEAEMGRWKKGEVRGHDR